MDLFELAPPFQEIPLKRLYGPQPQFSHLRPCLVNDFTQDLAGRALLLGDAAHSTGGTLGQGANSALQAGRTSTRRMVLGSLYEKWAFLPE